MRTTAIIAAYNEERTIADVLRALTASPLIDKVYVLPRTYIVTLTVIDDLGKTSATVSQTITPQ